MTHLNFAMTTLLNGIWQGALLAAAMWIVLKLFPRVNSTTRFTVLWLTLLAVAMLPVGPLALTEPASFGADCCNQYGRRDDIRARRASAAGTCAGVNVWIEFPIPA
jgi:hypothetical protein